MSDAPQFDIAKTMSVMSDFHEAIAHLMNIKDLIISDATGDLTNYVMAFDFGEDFMKALGDQS